MNTSNVKSVEAKLDASKCLHKTFKWSVCVSCTHTLTFKISKRVEALRTRGWSVPHVFFTIQKSRLGATRLPLTQVWGSRCTQPYANIHGKAVSITQICILQYPRNKTCHRTRRRLQKANFMVGFGWRFQISIKSTNSTYIKVHQVLQCL